MSNYDDIINLPHHVSRTRTPMPLENRAAQFAPFAALTGHDDAIAETARLTAKRPELSREELDMLSRRLAYAVEKGACVRITFFSPDPFKQGGSYEQAEGVIKKIEESENCILLTNGQNISLAEVVRIEGRIFEDINL